MTALRFPETMKKKTPFGAESEGTLIAPDG